MTKPKAIARQPDPRQVVSEANMTPDEVISRYQIDRRVARFQEAGNPLLMIEAFLMSCQSGFYPPHEVMDWVSSCFQAFHDAQGKASMDAVMGLKKRGGVPPFKAALIEERNEHAFTDMSALMHLGATRDEAAWAVHAAFEALDWNRTGYEITEPTTDTWIDMHARWEGHRAVTAWAAEYLDQPGNVAKFLRKFDPDHLPERLRRLY